MNILVPVTIILLVLSMATHSIFEKRVQSEKVQISYSGYMSALRESQGLTDESFYKSAPKKPPAKNPSPHEKKQTTAQDQTQKKKKKNCEYAKLNLFPLFTEDEESTKDLSILFKKLLTVLYGNNPVFKDPKMRDLLANEIIANGKAAFDQGLPFHPEQIVAKNPNIQPYLYKMLKGSKIYDFKKRIGCPSLLDFIRLEEEKTPRGICVACASEELLNTLFNPTIAKVILQRQETKPMGREELEKLLAKEHQGTKWDSFHLLDLCHKKHKGAKTQIALGVDTDTLIKVRKTVHLKS